MSKPRSYYVNKYGQPLPTSARDATNYNEPRYINPAEPCVLCNSKTPIRYTEDGSCYGCAVREFKTTLYNLQNGPDADTIATTPAEALERGLGAWFTGDACKRAPHPEKRDLESSGCLTCRERNPRQAALAKKESTYIPLKPCKRCGEKAEKRVDNGRCLRCYPVKRSKVHAPSAVLMQEAPDIVLQRTEASNMGFKVFRTGVKCKRGHTGFRYVSTGGCIECKEATD